MNPMNDHHAHLEPVNDEEIYKLSRPHKNLFKLYIIYSLTSLFLFPFVLIPMYFRYYTLRYKFDSEGISIAYGIFWRRESYVTYSRIQDIHVTRNIFERWFGLGTVAIQTASGSANSEESISGMMEFEQIRNFLYARMRGINSPQKTNQVSAVQANTASEEELVLLTSIRDEIRGTRQALERKHNA